MKGVPSQAQRSDRKAAIKRLKLLSFSQKSNIETFRAKIEREYVEGILPNRVEREERDFGGVKCQVLSPELYAKHKIIFHIHGGSFVGGSAMAYCGFCARVAHKSLCRVVLPDFTLAPHAFPASLKDAQNAFCALFAEEQVAVMLDGLKSMPKIVVMADGSGASIAYSLISTLKARYKESVHQVVLLSPWLDISDSAVVLSSKGVRDEVLSSEVVRRSATMYAADENRNSALCSLPKCVPQSLSSWPNVFIQMGEKEILLEDTKRAAELLKSQGVHCTLDVWPRMMHLFQLSNDLMLECRLAIDRIGHEVREGGKRQGDTPLQQIASIQLPLQQRKGGVYRETQSRDTASDQVQWEASRQLGELTNRSSDTRSPGWQGAQVFFNAPPLEESI